MRFRTFADATTSRSYRTYWQTWPATSFEDYTSLLTRVRRTHTMVDVVTPNFSTVRNKGGIICNPKYMEELYTDVDRTIFRLDGLKDGRTIKCEFHRDTLLEASLVQKLSSLSTAAMDTVMEEFSRETDLAIQRAHADVDVSEMMLLASIGELPETLAYLATLIQRVVKAVRAFRKGREVQNILRKLEYGVAENVVNAPKNRSMMRQLERYKETLEKRKLRKAASKSELASLDALANAWLELRYAIRPMIGDIQNAIAALSKTLESQRLTARGHEYRLGKSEENLSSHIVHGSMYIDTEAKVKEAESVKARAGCLYALDAEVASFVSIFGLDQIVESIYELIPFSFIFDWVFSMGDLLQGLFKSSGLDILTSWVSLEIIRTRSVHVTSAQVTGINGYSWTNQQVEFGSCHETVKYQWRKPNPEFPTMPRLDLKLDLAKIIDLGTIGRNLIGGKPVSQVIRRD